MHDHLHGQDRVVPPVPFDGVERGAEDAVEGLRAIQRRCRELESTRA
jgi:hypothetical protein